MRKTTESVNLKLEELERRIKLIEGWKRNPDFHGSVLKNAIVEGLRAGQTYITYNEITQKWIASDSGLEPDEYDLIGDETPLQTVSVSGSGTVDSFTSGSNQGVIWDYSAAFGANVRTGKVVAGWSVAGTIEYDETSTGDVGDTSDLVFTVSHGGGAGGAVVLQATSTNTWSIRFRRTTL